MSNTKKQFRVTQGQGCLNYFFSRAAAFGYASEVVDNSGLEVSVERWDAVLSEWATVGAKSPQEIQLNLGLNYTDDNGKVGEFDQELGRFLVETKFPHCGIVSEPYTSTWQCSKTGKTYSDNCLGFKISVSASHAFTISAIREMVRSLSILLKQDAAAFTVRNGDATHVELYYVDSDTPDKDEFDPKYFHYVV
jgi:hypothetical protein